MDIVTAAIACQNKINEQEKEIQRLREEIRRLNKIISSQKVRKKKSDELNGVFNGSLSDVKGYDVNNIRDLEILKDILLRKCSLSSTGYISGIGVCESYKVKELLDAVCKQIDTIKRDNYNENWL